MLNDIEKLMLSEIQLPDSWYELARDRYTSLASYLGRPDSELVKYDPQIQTQGSFRLGTAIYPPGKANEFDLDLTLICKGASTQNISQHSFKNLVLREISNYAKIHGMQDVEDNRRACTLHYREQNSALFHEDVVPAIPRLTRLNENVDFSEKDYPNLTAINRDAAIKGIHITDKDNTTYNHVPGIWNSSNPEGLALWFESKMAVPVNFSRMREDGGIDIIPIEPWKRKSELQYAVQLLKWHRDVKFGRRTKGKPTSVIISVLAAETYANSSSMSELLKGMLLNLRSNNYKVLNPVDPNENFTDKWFEKKHAAEHLKETFMNWLDQAIMDFTRLEASDITYLEAKKLLENNFDLKDVNLSGMNFKEHVKPASIKPDTTRRWSDCN